MKTEPFRILALDEEEYILGLYQKIFSPLDDGTEAIEGLSFDIVLCKQAVEAVQEVRAAIDKKRPFDLALIDIHLPPGPDGVWAAERVREMDSGMGIVLITGYEDTDIKEAQARIPPLDKLSYVEKPFGVKEIWQLASSMCARWKAEKEVREIHARLEAMVNERTSALAKANEQLKR